MKKGTKKKPNQRRRVVNKTETRKAAGKKDREKRVADRRKEKHKKMPRDVPSSRRAKGRP